MIFVDTLAALGTDAQPEILLTEPVGSCTDLGATVLRPLSHLFGDRYRLGPLAVLCKPEHGRKILGGGSGGFSPQAAYIFLKQLEEAQIIVLNKVDRLAGNEQHELLALLRDRFPRKKIVAASGVTGIGFDELLDALADDRFSFEESLADPSLDIDYDTYAAGEASLGWLNCGACFTSKNKTPFSLDELARHLVEQFSVRLLAANMEPGHVKVLASAGRSTAVANWVASDTPVELSVSSHFETLAADVLINLRVHGDPDPLAKLVTASIAAVAAPQQLAYQLSEVQHFRPSRPEPQHRYEKPTGK